MTRTAHIRSRAVTAAVAAGLLALSGGCYSKVVGGSGIGADSDRLKKNHEFGSERPVRDFVTIEQERRQK